MGTKIGIYGATGYTGVELVNILMAHKDVEIVFTTSESFAGKTLDVIDPLAPALPLIPSAEAPLDHVDHVFLCLPHTKSAPIAVKAINAGVKVVDLSADLRIDDAGVYKQWYKVSHPAPELLPAPYGLPELNRVNIVGADYVANPGCYPTSILIPTIPVLQKGLMKTGSTLIIDSKSGVTGAGRKPKPHIQFAALHRNFAPYAVGKQHRHLGEIEQELAKHGHPIGTTIFSPHLLPTDRGILSTIYMQVSDITKAEKTIRTAYEDEPLVKVLPGGGMASLKHVTHTPFNVISLHHADPDTLIVVSVIDNLLKGASSQAIQNFNIMWGYAETSGLLKEAS